MKRGRSCRCDHAKCAGVKFAYESAQAENRKHVENMDQQGAGQRHSGRGDEVDEGVTLRGSEESRRSSVDSGFGRRTKNKNEIETESYCAETQTVSSSRCTGGRSGQESAQRTTTRLSRKQIEA